MIYDFALNDCPPFAHSDVCVIGAGAAGILVATQLAACGRQVILLEGGGRELEARSQEIYRSELTGRPYAGIYQGRFRTYGGTTTRWIGQIIELDNDDFGVRDWVAGSGWPFAKSELAKFYDRALEFEGLGRPNSDDELIRKALRQDTIDVSPEFALTYSRWCPELNFTRLHEAALRDSERVSIYLHANVVELCLNDAKTAIGGVRVRNFQGREVVVTADSFVVCMGGIETTRLLLQPAGENHAPWQISSVLGRHYQDHICCDGILVEQLSTQPPRSYFGQVEFGGVKYHNKIQLNHAEQKKYRTLNIVGAIGPRRSQQKEKALDTIRAARNVRRGITAREALETVLHLPGIMSQRIHQRIRGESAAWKSLMLSVHSEQLPESKSTLSLSGTRDELGMLRTSLNWVIAKEELHSIRTYVRRAQAIFKSNGLAIVSPPPGFYDDDAVLLAMCKDSCHHMGGTRMSSSPSSGIVDTNLRLHGIANAYVCSSSVFPCSGFSNPTHTLLALAMRLSEHLDCKLRFKSQAASERFLMHRTPEAALPVAVSALSANAESGSAPLFTA